MYQKIKVLILGSTGQLGSALNNLLKKDKKLKLIKLKKEIDNLNIKNYLNKIQTKVDIIINCIAYTDVEKSNTDKKKTLLLNKEFPNYLAKYCKINDTILIHFSTDFVFSTKSKIKISENSKYSPINFYGYSKMMGEKCIIRSNAKYLIFRTSWLYSRKRKNFLKTILTKIRERKKLHVISDNYGIPTSTKFIVDFFKTNFKQFLNESNQKQIFHLVPNGYCSWYEFSLEIHKVFFPKRKNETIYPISYKKYFSKIKRPVYSILSNKKIKYFFNCKVLSWKNYLKYYKKNI